MAASLNWIADVATTDDAPNYLRVQIIVRNNVATVSRNGTVLEERSGVVAVEAVESRRRLVRFDDGTAWAAILPNNPRPGCGCT